MCGKQPSADILTAILRPGWTLLNNAANDGQQRRHQRKGESDNRFVHLAAALFVCVISPNHTSGVAHLTSSTTTYRQLSRFRQRTTINDDNV